MHKITKRRKSPFNSACQCSHSPVFIKCSANSFAEEPVYGFLAISFKYSLATVIERFVTDLRLKGFTDVTVSQYRYDLDFYQSHMSKNILVVSTLDIKKFLIHLKTEHDYKNSSLTRKIAFLRSFYRFLKDEGIRRDTPASSIKFPKILEKPIEYLSKDAIKKLVDLIDNYRDRLLVKILYYEGLRRTEITKIRKKDINLDKGTMLIQGKGDKQRIIPIHPKLRLEIKKYIEPLDSEEQLFSLVPRMINDILNKYSKRIGSHIYPHLMRHTFAAHLYKETKNIWLVSKMLGHSKIETTVKYLRSLNVLHDFSAEYENAFNEIFH